MHILAHNVLTSLCPVLPVIAEINEGVQFIGSFENDMASPAAVAAVRTASRHILLPPETDTPPAAVTGFYKYLYVIDKIHEHLSLFELLILYQINGKEISGRTVGDNKKSGT
jgi:hypothetical protein